MTPEKLEERAAGRERVPRAPAWLVAIVVVTALAVLGWLLLPSLRWQYLEGGAMRKDRLSGEVQVLGAGGWENRMVNGPAAR